MPIDYKMYAILKDGYVIDLAFNNNKLITSPMTFNTYSLEEHEIVEMTLENSPAKIGSFYNGKTFEY